MVDSNNLSHPHIELAMSLGLERSTQSKITVLSIDDGFRTHDKNFPSGLPFSQSSILDGISRPHPILFTNLALDYVLFLKDFFILFCIKQNKYV